MPTTNTFIFSAGVLFVTFLLAYVCGPVGRKQYLNPCPPLEMRRSEQQHSRALRQRDEKVTLHVEEPSSDVYSGVMKKTAFSSNKRMIFAVGLEGTGHHFVHPLIRSVCELETVVCPDMCGDMYKGIYTKMGRPETATVYKTGLASVQQAMEELAVSAYGLNGTASILAHFANCKTSLSYPNNSGPDKPLQYVDMKILAREAERAGIDFRLLYLVRSAREIIISNTQHRDFGGT